MGGFNFHDTVMGRRFYEAQFPALINELRKLNKNLEKLISMGETDSLSISLPSKEKPKQQRVFTKSQ